MTKTITIALTAVSLMLLSAFAANEAAAYPGLVTIKPQTYVCSIAPVRRQYRLVKKDLEHAAADTDFYGERIARNAIRDAEETLREPTNATCEARSLQYRDAIRTIERALRKVELRNEPPPEPQHLRVNLTAMSFVR